VKKNPKSQSLQGVEKLVDWFESQGRLWSALVLFPLLLINLHIWTFTEGSLLLPLDMKFFDWNFDAWHQSRWVFPLWSQHLFFFGISFAGFFLLLLNLLLIQKILLPFRIWGLWLGLLGISLLYPMAAPGRSPLELIHLSFCLLLLCLVTYGASKPLFLGFFGLISLWLALTHPFFWMNAFWVSFTVCLATGIVFLFAERGRLSFRQRLNWSFTISYALGVALLFGLGLLLFWQSPWPLPNFGLSDFWWLAYLNLVLAVFYAWKEPWKTHLNLRLALLGLGPLISPDLLLLSLLVTGFLSFRILMHLVKDKNLPGHTRLALQVSCLMIALSMVLIHLILHRDPREWKPQWVSMLTQISPSEPEGVVIFGKALPYLAHFYRGPLLENPDLWMMTSEEDFKGWMEENDTQSIVADLEFVRDQWRALIDSGESAEVIGASVLSRLLIHRGEAIETATIQIPPIENFVISEGSPDGFVWIRMRTSNP
jgi:hypothetical protein